VAEKSPRVPGGRSERSTRIYWSPEEAAVVETRAARLGIRVSRLLRELALAPESPAGATERRTQIATIYGLQRSLSAAALELRATPGNEVLIERIRGLVEDADQALACLVALGRAS
jgi:hypothetical protein